MVDVRDNCDIADTGIQIGFRLSVRKNGFFLFYLEIRPDACRMVKAQEKTDGIFSRPPSV
jgi:hypothetical protein